MVADGLFFLGLCDILQSMNVLLEKEPLFSEFYLKIAAPGMIIAFSPL
jgi:hypothetical protein